MLIVEDSDECRGAWVHAFEAAGFAVGEAADGFDALARLRELDPDAIVLDLILPGVSGFAIAREASRAGRAPKTVIVAVSGVGSSSLHSEARACGCDVVLRKPVAPGDIVEHVRRLLSAHTTAKARAP